MDTATAEETLDDCLSYGLEFEIYYANEAKSLCMTVGKYADKIKECGYGLLFGSLQGSYLHRQTLCVAKMFDRETPPPPHLIRSIPPMLNLMERHAALWSLHQRDILENLLANAGQDLQTVSSLDNECLALAVVAHYRKTLPSVEPGAVDPLSVALKKLQKARSWSIAHNDAFPQDSRSLPTWGEAELLLDYAKDFSLIINRGFLGSYMERRDIYEPGETHESSCDLRRLLKAANIIT